MEDKKNWRRDDLATRIDLRMPNELYDRVVEIATAAGEKVNPKSGQVRLTATINRLIETGIRYSSDRNLTILVNNPIDNPTPIGLESRVSDLEVKYRSLSDNNPVNSTNEAIDQLRLEISQVRELASNLQGEIAAVQTAIREREVEIPVLNARNTTTPRQEKPITEGEPDWVNADNRRFYTKLVNDPVLVGKVAEAIVQYPKDNKALATSLVEIGLHKNDGTALDSASVSRIKAVVGHLQQ